MELCESLSALSLQLFRRKRDQKKPVKISLIEYSWTTEISDIHLKQEFHKHFKLKATLSTQGTAQGAPFHNDRTTWLRHVCQMKKKDTQEKQHV